MINKYSITAVESVELCLNDITVSPIQAWERISTKYFGAGTSSQIKGCPRGSFLGLCQEGYIKGISKKKYTSSDKNRHYAIEAVKALKQNPELANDIIRLWKTILNNKPTKHNSQMNVVIGLWKAELINNT